MKQTAVEWLINEHFGGIENCTPDFRYHIKQAKEIEKEQIIESYRDGRSDQQSDKHSRFYNRISEQYYNETMKQTAVEWLENQIKTSKYFYKLIEELDNRGTVAQLSIIEQAKEMEKEQMKEMYLKGIENYDPTFKRK